MQSEKMPRIPYGAVYYRKSSPPREDWERDYKQASDDGMNAFRHWFLWSAIEVAPGKYDWDDYDHQLDLAAKYGIKTIIAEILGTAPQWAFRKYPHARVESANGSKTFSRYTAACAVKGAPGLCLDNEDVKQQAEKFLHALVERYRDHPGIDGYDVWNELNMTGEAGGCYCQASTQKFREWLKVKYGNLDALNKAWYGYSYASWEDIEIPRTVGPYPDSMDWVLFRIDNASRLFKWKIEIIKGLDKKHPVTAHAISHGALDRVGPGTYPIWQAGEMVDVFGYSGGGNHQEYTRLRWLHWLIVDLTRAASKDKPFWSAEMASGASWGSRMKPLYHGRITTASDVCLYSLTSFAGGATGIFSPRWRPLLDGRFMGCFAFYDMDGSPTERSKMAGQMAKWANNKQYASLWQAKPVRGDLGILVVPESQIHCYISKNSTEFYYRSITGAYQAFLFNNIQADFVYARDIGPEYDVLYLPYPTMLPAARAEALKTWVANGGCLISEGCPAYFGDRGRAGTRQPNYGLDELFGVTQQDIQFTPDLLDELRVTMDSGLKIRGGVFLQSYIPTTGKACGTYSDGRIAAVDNVFGEGRTRLIGTFPGYGYAKSQDEETRQFFAELLPWAGKTQHITSSDGRLIVRLHTGQDITFLWVINSARENVQADLTLSESWGSFRDIEPFWGEKQNLRNGRTVSVSVPAREALVMKLVQVNTSY